MAIEKTLVQNRSIEFSKEPDITYYLDLGRRSYTNYIIHKYESDLDIAISSYEKTMQIDPENAEAYYKIASLLWEKGQIDIESAIKYCMTATKLAPKDVDAKMHLGYFFKAEGKLEEAIIQFREAIKIGFSKSAKPRIALGLSLIQKARLNTNKLSEVSIGLCHFVLGLLLLLNDNKSTKLIYNSLKEEAKVFKFKLKGKLSELLINSEAAMNVYNDAIESVSDKAKFLESAGDLLKKNKNYLTASDYYRKSISLDPTNKELYHKLLSVLDDEFDTKEIIKTYKKLIEIEPENHAIIYSLGHIYLEDKNYFGAIECFRKSIIAEPENAFYHNSLAYTLIQLEDFDGAINEYQKAITLNPDSTWTSIVCQALAAIYYQAKENKEAAIMAYQMSLSYDPDSVDALTAIAEIHYDKRNYDSAITCYERSLELDPENSQAECNLGFVYWEKGENKKAIEHYEKAVSLNPKYDIAYNNLGVAYLDGLQDSTKAINMFEIALKSNPNYALAYYNKGRCLEFKGNNTEAADYYQMALDINTFTNEMNPDEIETRLSKLFKVD